MHRKIPLAALAIVLAWTGPASSVPVESHWLLSQGFALKARAVPPGAKLRVEDVPLDTGSRSRTGDPPTGQLQMPAQTLDLERIEVFSPSAEIVVHRGANEVRRRAPDTAYFTGRIEGRPGSFAFLSVDKSRQTRGLIADGSGTWRIRSREGTPEVELVDPNEPFADGAAPWECGNEDVPLPASAGAMALPTGLEKAAAADTVYAASIAIETDAEFHALFSSTSEAVEYVGDLFAAISAIYQRDIKTILQVSHLSLWPNGPSSDPWTATTSSAGLNEFLSYWNSNRGSVERTVAHFLSGKSTGGGVAYVSVLCSSSAGYGFTGSLNGEFSTTNLWLLWDLFGVSHELGHNFGSGHTHCYSPPVDQCYGAQTGCYAGAASVPSNGGGSIMSYCHTQSGGYGNINLWLGRAGFYGTQSERVTNLMRSRVESAACIDEIDGPPTVSLQVSPATIAQGGTSTLSWESSGADECEFVAGLAGGVATSGSLQVSPSSDRTYELECSGPGGTASDSATLDVGPAPTPTPVPSPTPVPTPSPMPMRVETSGSCGSPPNCVTTIQDAIDLAHDEDTIQVASGAYGEDIVVERSDLEPVKIEAGWNESFSARPSGTLTITSSGGGGETVIRSMTISAGTVTLR